MFARRAGNRLNSAEEALAAGRIDEAFALADSPDVAKQNGAQRLMADIADAL